MAERVAASELGAAESTSWEWDITSEDVGAGHAPSAVNRGKLLAVKRSDGFEEHYTYQGVLAQMDSARRVIPRPGGGASVELVMGYGYDDQGRANEIHFPGNLNRSQVLSYNNATRFA